MSILNPSCLFFFLIVEGGIKSYYNRRKKRVWVFFLTPLVYEKNIFHSFLWKGSQEYFIKVFKSIVSEFAT